MLVSLLVTIISCFGTVPPQHEAIQENSFKDYIKEFTYKNMPFMANREVVYNLSRVGVDTVTMTYKQNPFPELKHEYRKFLPKDLIGDHTISNFRCVYVLPEHNGTIPVIIAMDFFRSGEQYMLKLFLITYNEEGQILGFIKLGGYYVDLWEEFFIIQNGQIKTVNYQFKDAPDKNVFTLQYCLETQKTYKIDSTGHIIKIGDLSRKGYFKENGWAGYIFVK